MSAFEATLAAYQARINAVLTHYLNPPQNALMSVMDYATLNGGKRLRALLVYLTGKLLAVSEQELDVLAASVEMIHAFSLIHDDLPAMDNDTLRRGKPTCHIAFGEAAAILAGDALQSLAFELLASVHSPQFSVEKRLKMIETLSEATGYLGMAGGQFQDIAATGHLFDEVALQSMHALKTGKLISASVLLPAIAASVTSENKAALLAFSQELGLAFQIWDDILDIEGTSEIMGKTANKDAAHVKPTYPLMLGLERAKTLAHEAKERAIAKLHPFGQKADTLRALAVHVVTRKS